MKWIVAFVMLAFVIGCDSSKRRISGSFHGFYFDTYHNILFSSDNTFEYITEGHLGGDSIHGSYSISNDTVKLGVVEDYFFSNHYKLTSNGCLIDLEIHIDLCKDTDRLSEEPLKVNYPQLPSSSKRQIEQLQLWMCEALGHSELDDYVRSNDTIFIKEYFEMDTSFSFVDSISNRIVEVISLQNIENYDEYLIVSSIRIGIKSVSIRLRENGIFGGCRTIFEKEKGQWKKVNLEGKYN